MNKYIDGVDIEEREIMRDEYFMEDKETLAFFNGKEVSIVNAMALLHRFRNTHNPFRLTRVGDKKALTNGLCTVYLTEQEEFRRG